MKVQIIIPAHNEEEFLPICLDSILHQSFQNWSCLVVDDGSSDQTWEIIQDFKKKDYRISGVQRQTSTHQPGAKVVHCFDFGLKQTARADILCKFDADIAFPADYLSRIVAAFQKEEKLGMCSGLVYIYKEGKWVFEAISSRKHIRGPIKAYRSSAFQKMGGLRPVLGWDNLDVMLIEKQGYLTQTLDGLKVRHLRPTAHHYQKEKYQKLGRYFRNIGLDLPLVFIAALKVGLKEKKGLLTILNAYINTAYPSHLSPDEICFIRKWRWRKILRI